MLTVTDVRTLKTAKIYYFNAAHRHTSMCSRLEKQLF